LAALSFSIHIGAGFYGLDSSEIGGIMEDTRLGAQTKISLFAVKL